MTTTGGLHGFNDDRPDTLVAESTERAHVV